MLPLQRCTDTPIVSGVKSLGTGLLESIHLNSRERDKLLPNVQITHSSKPNSGKKGLFSYDARPHPNTRVGLTKAQRIPPRIFAYISDNNSWNAGMPAREEREEKGTREGTAQGKRERAECGARTPQLHGQARQRGWCQKWF